MQQRVSRNQATMRANSTGLNYHDRLHLPQPRCSKIPRYAGAVARPGADAHGGRLSGHPPDAATLREVLAKLA